MIEVLKQAAEDVSKAYDVLAFTHTERALELLAKTRTALRQAIAELESQEPYALEALMYSNDRIKVDPVTGNVSIGTPQRTWVGLTDEEIAKIGFESADRESAVIQTIDKLKERNA
jgi:hypothetical protein